MIVAFMQTMTTEYRISRFLSWIAVAILVLLPFHAFFTTWIGSNTDHLDLLRIWKEILIFALLPILAWLVAKSSSLRSWLLRSWITRLIGLYILLNVALGVWAIVDHRVNQAALIYALLINLRLFGVFIFCFIVASYSDLIKRHWKVIILIPAALVIVFGLMQQFLLPHDFLRHFGYSDQTISAYQTVDSNSDYYRVKSTLRGANPLGAYLVLILPAMAIALSGRRMARIGGLAAGAVVLFYSYSRSAWAGVLLAFGGLAGWPKRNSQRHKVALLSLALAAIITAGFLVLRSNRTVQNTLFHTSDSSTSAVSSNSQRTLAMENAAKDVLRQPLGGGTGTAGPASSRNNHPARIAENYYLQLGQEIGVAGVALFIAINALVARELWARRSNQLARVLLASLVGITFVNFLSHAWTDDTLAYLWWGLAGVACALPRSHSSGASATAILKHKQNG